MSIELPKLPPICIMAMNRSWYWFEDVQEREAVRDERERILLARIKESDEQRSQWAGLCVRLEARIAELEASNNKDSAT